MSFGKLFWPIWRNGTGSPPCLGRHSYVPILRVCHVKNSVRQVSADFDCLHRNGPLTFPSV
ncbi:rCG22904 [Rattus norvegicus]|uniref:RCG22904 n=1 Tax=Rattus norvegicus TaxID=10116 RepID=A6KPB0_RAT|nr:rCG22904 [Rattus norvegicus]